MICVKHIRFQYLVVDVVVVLHLRQVSWVPLCTSWMNMKEYEVSVDYLVSVDDDLD